MSRHRHSMKHKAKGGAVYYEGSGSNVAKEAAEKEQHKRGGRVKHTGKVMGEKSKHRLDKRARGGRMSDEMQDKKMVATGVHKHEKHMHKGEKETKFAHGGAAKHHHVDHKTHTAHKARGGKVGADKSPMAPGSARHPFSSAAR